VTFPFADSTRVALQWSLPAALALLALAVPWIERHGTRGWRRGHAVLLALVVLLGFGLYTSQNWQSRRYFNPYEFFHYYVGSKYMPELGYTRLYDAAVLVDRETGFPHRSRDIANLSAHHGGPEFRRLSGVYAEEAAIRAPFTPERWESFVRDVVWFRDQLAPSMWERLLHDKGYNATPAWTLVGKTLAERVPTTQPAAVRALAALDVALLVGALACVGWAFGTRALLFAAGLYLTHYCTSHAHFKAAFLRTDWLFALVAAAACLKKERFALAGALLAWSALSRVFPLLFAAGPLAVLALSLVRRDDPRRAGALRFVAGLALAGTLVVGATLVAGGVEPWREFGAKIAEHDQRPASDTIGFRKLFLWTLDFERDQGPAIRARFEERRAIWIVAQAGFVALLAWLVRRRTLCEALGLAFVLVWSLAAPAYYYYAFLLVPLVWFADRLDLRGRALGLALLFATSVLARAVHGGLAFEGHFDFKLSAAFGALAAYMVASAVLEERAERQRGPLGR
jgi:hypothetical protein